MLKQGMRKGTVLVVVWILMNVWPVFTVIWMVVVPVRTKLNHRQGLPCKYTGCGIANTSSRTAEINTSLTTCFMRYPASYLRTGLSTGVGGQVYHQTTVAEFVPATGGILVNSSATDRRYPIRS